MICSKCFYANCKIRSQCRVTDIIKNSRDICWSCFIPYDFHTDSNCIKTVKYSLLSLLVKQNRKIDSLKAYFYELLLKHINKISNNMSKFPDGALFGSFDWNWNLPHEGKCRWAYFFCTLSYAHLRSVTLTLLFLIN